MVSMMLAPIMIMMSLMGGAGQDMLDYLPTDLYWESQGVDPANDHQAIIGFLEIKQRQPGDVSQLIRQLGDASFERREQATAELIRLGREVLPQVREATRSTEVEIAERARHIISQISDAAKADQIRQLMAIRTLGELKHRPALGRLRTLAGSDDFFVADYARAAIAKIEGRPSARTTPTREQLDRDLALLSPKSGVVAQSTSLTGGQVIGLDTLIGMMPMLGEQELARVRREGAEQVGRIAGQTGNVRISSITIGVSDEIGRNVGSAVLVFRGHYDQAATLAAFEDWAQAEITAFQIKKIDDMTMVMVEENLALLMPSSDRMIAVIGANEREMQLPQLLERLKANRPQPQFSEPVRGLIGQIDRTRPIWLAAHMSEDYKEMLDQFGHFDSIVMSARSVEQQMQLQVEAQSKDPEKTAQTAEMINQGIAMAKAQLGQLEQGIRGPAKPVRTLLESIKVRTDGGKLQIEGQAGPETPMILPMFWLLAFDSSRPVPAAQPARVDEAAPVAP